MIDEWSREAFIRVCHHALTVQPNDENARDALVDFLAFLQSAIWMLTESEQVQNHEIADRLRALTDDAQLMEKLTSGKTGQAMH